MTEAKGGNGKVGKGQELALARVELRRQLAKAPSARQRLDLLISHEKCELIVPSLPAEDLYFTVKEVGLSDSVELVRLASPEQFRAFIDLDCWKRDQFEPRSVLGWLRAAGTDEDEQRFRKKIGKLDIEVLELVLRSTVKVHDLEEEPDPEPEGQFFRSPEGRFMVEYTVEGMEQAGTKRLLDELYAEDPFRTARLLESIRWEVPSELEETAFRWRSGRMQDLGFPELSEAVSYFGYVDPDATLPTLEKAPAVPGSLVLSRWEDKGRFLDRAAALVSEDARAILERQLVTVLNSVMVVESVDPGDLAAVQRALESARDTLSLGLEHASRGDTTAAAALLVSAPLKRIFQVGNSLGLKLKFRADRLMKTGKASLPGSADEPLLDRPLGAAVRGVRRKRPRFAEALEDPRAADDALRPFRSREDLARLGDALTRAEAICAVLERLGFDPRQAAKDAEEACPVELLPFLKHSDFFLTAIARELAGQGFAFKPLPAAAVEAFAARAFVDKDGEAALSDEVAALAREKVRGEHAEAAAKFVETALERLRQEVAPLWTAKALTPGKAMPLLVGP